MEIRIRDYNKSIRKKKVLTNINFQFESGRIYGLYGRNGSGKTMILRAIAGLIIPTSGSIEIDGQILHKDMDFPADVGVIIERTDLLPQYTGFENLKILGKINGTITDEEIIHTLKLVGLEEMIYAKVKDYSLGMKQKISIAQAIFEKPKLLLLDEPTSALDEGSIHQVREIFLDLKRSGCLIIIASHNKEDLQVLADEVLLIENGEIK